MLLCQSAIRRIWRCTKSVHHYTTSKSTIEKKDSFPEPIHVIRGLKAFHQNYNHFFIPRDYVIPPDPDSNKWPSDLEGLRIGYYALSVRRAIRRHPMTSRYLKPNLVQMLSDIGFPMRGWVDYELTNAIIPGIKRFESLYGHSMISLVFEVPDNDQRWPRQLWNYKLGAKIHRIRKGSLQLTVDQIKKLDEFGFIWNHRASKWEEYILPALTSYYKIHGNLLMPYTFEIPDGDVRFPKIVWKYPLGRVLFAVRHGQYAEYVKRDARQLEKIGFNCDGVDTEINLAALQKYREFYGTSCVPTRFVVPSEPPWPKEMWNLKLGPRLEYLRSRAHRNLQMKRRWKYIGNYEMLQNRTEHNVQNIVVPCLRIYQSLYPNAISVPVEFVVPKSNEWPVVAQGFKLGSWMTRYRYGMNKISSKLVRELESTGFAGKLRELRWKKMILPALQAYAKVHQGSCQGIGTHFQVPAEDPYPAQTWGLKLGGAVWHIRNGDTYASDPEKQAMLQELGVLS